MTDSYQTSGMSLLFPDRRNGSVVLRGTNRLSDDRYAYAEKVIDGMHQLTRIQPASQTCLGRLLPARVASQVLPMPGCSAPTGAFLPILPIRTGYALEHGNRISALRGILSALKVIRMRSLPRDSRSAPAP